MTKVLLTGASGFAGSHLLEHILDNTDWEVVCVCSWKHKGTPERIQEVLANFKDYRARVKIITHDLQSPFTEMTKKEIGQCDYIINLASESHVDRSIETPVPFIKNNIDLVLTMLEFAREYPPKVFLQFSTDEVYGVAPEGINHPEWAPIVPSNPYSASKACQEAIAISYWRTYNIPLIITNTMNIFGEMQDSEKYIAKVVRFAVEGQTIPVHGTPDRIGSRFYLHGRNMADAVLYIINNITPILYSEDHDLRPERINIVGDVELNNLEVAGIIHALMGKKLVYAMADFHSTRPGHDRRYALDGTKLRNLGWKSPLSFRESLEKYINWTLQHLKWL